MTNSSQNSQEQNQEVAATQQESEQLAMTNTEENNSAVEVNQMEVIGNLLEKKANEVQAKDIQEVDERAQKRAFDKVTAEETLTLIYEATEEFTIPGLKEKLQKHREACQQVKQSRDKFVEVNNFLSQAIKLALKKPPTSG